MRLADLEKLNVLEKELLEEALLVVKNPNTSWDYYTINRNPGGYAKISYFATRYKKGYLLLLNSNLYFSLEEVSYNWECMGNPLFIGDFEEVGETFCQLTEVHYKSRFFD